MRLGGAAALLAIALGGIPALAEEAPPGHLIRCENDALTVRLVRVPVWDVLAEVGRQTGAEIRGQPRDPREVTAEFDAVPLPEALNRLLAGQNFALVYGDGGKLRAVKLLGTSTGTATAVNSLLPAVPTTTIPAAPISPLMLVQLFERHPPIPIAGKLRDAVGTDTATFMQLIDVGLHNEEPLVRLEAIRTTIQAIESEPELRAGLLGAVGGMDQTEVVGIIRSAAGDRAEEITMNIASQARNTEVRAKASTLLQQLRKPKS
jgi:hypothetical protein